MSAFSLAIDSIFDDPNIAGDALWRAGGQGDGVPVRIIRKSPEAIVGLGGNQYDLDAMLIDVRLSEVPSPAQGDTFEMQAEDGEPAGTVEVIGLSKIDAHRIVRTLEVQMVQPDPDEDAP
ncbi:head-tail joining protein [Methylobacterium brachythecii]|uniref:Uncharacterized protein n=1 Tax=Methylobacterium brachythecii TaxID=1176177 RepID=A0A7W6F890_9HYPH|nr:hypothetical protein [Methylobacterium brachythecii]MBB3904189.1 hypothetical protein [Methylobacterium brachythecii]GLS45149.1 hypothetical protein GCM10007884_31380 [Methylobacterium brachythecii]